jgi:hypothetical protein
VLVLSAAGRVLLTTSSCNFTYYRGGVVLVHVNIAGH